jgi:hypothetical protein
MEEHNYFLNDVDLRKGEWLQIVIPHTLCDLLGEMRRKSFVNCGVHPEESPLHGPR